MSQPVSIASCPVPDCLADWVGAEPCSDLGGEIAAQLVAVQRFETDGPEGEEGLEVLLGMATRSRDAAERVKPIALQAALPLPAELRTQVVGLIAVQMRLAGLLQGVVERAWKLDGDTARAGADVLTAQALGLLREAYLMSCLAASVTPYGLWLRAHALGLHGVEYGVAGAPSSSVAYKHLLALAAARPEGLSARELLWLDTYLYSLAGLAVLEYRDGLLESGGFVVDVARDVAPIAGRQALEMHVRSLCFCAAPLVRRAGEQLEWLGRHVDRSAGIAGDVLALAGMDARPDLPEGLSLGEQVLLLRALREHWTRPPQRVRQRREEHHPARLCAGLGSIWEVLKTPAESHGVHCEVMNLSDGGYGVVSASARLEALDKGTPIALRYEQGQPWVLCVARWIQQQADGPLELGLQALGPLGKAVSVAFRCEDGMLDPVPALLLPPMVGVRRQAALAVPAGTYNGQRFTLVDDGASLYVAEANVLMLELETGVFEVFQFQVDPYSD